MNNTFDLHRFGMVLRWDLLTNKKRYIFGLLGLILGFTGCFVGSLYSIRGWAEAIANGESAPGAPSLSDFFIDQSYTFFWIFLAIVMVVMACKVFHNMRTKVGRINFMMLPATNLEKFIARLLVMTVGAFVMVILALIGGDMIQFAASFVITPSFHTSLSWPILSQWSSAILSYTPMQMLDIFCFLLLIHSFCILGGSFYRKQAVVLTIVTGTILLFVFGYTATWLHELGVFPFAGHIMQNFEFENEVFQTLAIVCTLLFAAFNYWASYKLFTHMQVICNKWINI